MIRPRLLAAVPAMLLLAACGSAPMHYHTLVPAATEALPARAPFQFELAPVGIPVQVDQPQLVVRESGQGVAILDGERWIAPLPDELRAALSADLARQLGAQDATGQPGNGHPRVRVHLDVRRFDSLPGSHVQVESVWSAAAADGKQAAVTCTSGLREDVGAGYDALVQGHQQAIAALAVQIAPVVRALASGQPAACPGS